MTKNFRTFLKRNSLEEAPEMTSTDLAFSLTRTLGSKLVRKGWNTGSKGSGIVAMTDLEDGKVKEAQNIIKDFLKSVKADATMKKGKVSGESIFSYKGFVIAVVETANSVKVTVS